MKENIVQEKSYTFALKIIAVYKSISKNEMVLGKQLLRSGTSIGANVEEAIGGQTKRDFLSKITIAYKEARETLYWIRLLVDSRILDDVIGNSLKSDCEELIRIIGSIQKTTKEGLTDS